MVRSLVIVCAVLAVGCERPEVYVECLPQATGFSCSLEQRAGSERTRTCWTIRLVCQNGTKSEARTCHETQPSGKISVSVPEARFPGLEVCDAASSVSVVSVYVEPK